MSALVKNGLRLTDARPQGIHGIICVTILLIDGKKMARMYFRYQVKGHWESVMGQSWRSRKKSRNRHAGLDKPAPAFSKPGASGTYWYHWIPACAGMTENGIF